MDICLIQVPSHAGDEGHPASAGPSRLLQAGAADLLATQGHRVTTERADRGGPFRDTASSSRCSDDLVTSTAGHSKSISRLHWP